MLTGLVAAPSWVFEGLDHSAAIRVPLEKEFEEVGLQAFDFEDVEEVRLLVDKYVPTIVRFGSALRDVETDRSQLLLLALRYLSWLRSMGIGRIVYFTGSPHHSDTAAISCAAEVAGVSQFFLYSGAFSSRVALVRQLNLGRREVVPDLIFPDGQGFDAKAEMDMFLKNSYFSHPVRLSTLRKLISQSLSAALTYGVLQLMTLPISLLWQGKGQRRARYPFQYVLTDMGSALAQRNYWRKLKRSSRQLRFTDLDARSDIVFYASMQPESTTFPEAYPLDGHLQAIALLRVTTPWLRLIYKEHHANLQFFDARTLSRTRVGFYRNIHYWRNLVNMSLWFLQDNLPTDTSERDIPFAATTTGTIAVERSSRGLRTLVLGEPWYKGLPGIVTLAELEAFRQIPSHWSRPDSKLAQEAEAWILNYLYTCTIPNPGVGDPAFGDSCDKELFVREFDRALTRLPH